MQKRLKDNQEIKLQFKPKHAGNRVKLEKSFNQYEKVNIKNVLHDAHKLLIKHE